MNRDSLGTVLHVRNCLPCRVVPLVVLAGPVQGREVGVDGPRGLRRATSRDGPEPRPSEP